MHNGVRVWGIAGEPSRAQGGGMFVLAGVTGRVGGVVAEILLARGLPVRVLVRTPDAVARWQQRGAEAVRVDLADEAALTRALDGAAGLFALVPDGDAARGRITDALAAAVRAARVGRVVLLSALASTGPAAELRRAEAALGRTRAVCTFVRAAYFQDNVAAALPLARGQGVYGSLLASPDVVVPTVATADVAAVVAACLEQPPAHSEIVDVVGPAYSVRQIAAALGGAIGRALDVVTVGVEALGDLPRAQAEGLVALHAELSRGPALDGDHRVVGKTPLAQTLALLVGPDRSTIPAVVAALTDAWNRHDLYAMGALYRADADFVNIFGGLLCGRDEIVREHVLRHQRMFAAARMTHEPPAIRRLGPTLAAARVAWTMRGIADGVDRAGLMLHLLEHGPGGWSIVASQNTELASAPRLLDAA